MIQPPPYDAVAAWGIGGLAVLVALAWVRTWSAEGSRIRQRLAGGAALVLGVSGIAARSGVLQRFDSVPPPMAVMIASVFALAFAVGLSPFGRGVAASVPLATLVGLQAFRLPLELFMHRAATLGIMPPELSYSGYNFDIATGSGAALLWLVAQRKGTLPRTAVWLWNLWGIWCLVVIAIVAVTTSPMVRLFGDDPRHLNTWVLYFPYVWLPTVLVTIAVTSHVVITRKLLTHAGKQPVAGRRKEIV